MRHRALRHIASLLLLASYLPMVVLSSVHVHHDTVDTTDECMQCSGHLESQHHHHDNCQYCNFLNLDYFGQAGQQVAAPTPTVKIVGTTAVAPSLQSHYGVARLRAPPAA